MAFPGTYNFSYYKGDTLEFRIYPKDTTGAAFDLSSYENVSFVIATERGSGGIAGKIDCFADIDTDEDFVLCTITPANGAELEAGTTYLYDVEISKDSSPYDYVYTLLTGSISVTDEISGASGVDS